MDDTYKLQLIQALQDIIRLKQEVWKLSDQLTKPNVVEQGTSATSREIEIAEIQNQLAKVTELD